MRHVSRGIGRRACDRSDLLIDRPSTLDYDHITADQHLRDFCESIAAAPIVAFDTEFVSEDSFLPELCLIQLAANERLAIVDPFEVQDLSPLWNLLTAPGRETLVHAGREEFRFTWKHTGQRP